MEHKWGRIERVVELCRRLVLLRVTNSTRTSHRITSSGLLREGLANDGRDADDGGGEEHERHPEHDDEQQQADHLTDGRMIARDRRDASVRARVAKDRRGVKGERHTPRAPPFRVHLARDDVALQYTIRSHTLSSPNCAR